MNSESDPPRILFPMVAADPGGAELGRLVELQVCETRKAGGAKLSFEYFPDMPNSDMKEYIVGLNLRYKAELSERECLEMTPYLPGNLADPYLPLVDCGMSRLVSARLAIIYRCAAFLKKPGRRLPSLCVTGSFKLLETQCRIAGVQEIQKKWDLFSRYVEGLGPERRAEGFIFAYVPKKDSAQEAAAYIRESLERLGNIGDSILTVAGEEGEELWAFYDRIMPPPPPLQRREMRLKRLAALVIALVIASMAAAAWWPRLRYATPRGQSLLVWREGETPSAKDYPGTLQPFIKVEGDSPAVIARIAVDGAQRVFSSPFGDFRLPRGVGKIRLVLSATLVQRSFIGAGWAYIDGKAVCRLPSLPSRIPGSMLPGGDVLGRFLLALYDKRWYGDYLLKGEVGDYLAGVGGKLADERILAMKEAIFAVGYRFLALPNERELRSVESSFPVDLADPRPREIAVLPDQYGLTIDSIAIRY